MSAITTRDVDYDHAGTRLSGLLLVPESGGHGGTVVLIHDAFGLAGFSLGAAHRYAAAGYTVFAADMWGDRFAPASESEIGPLIGALVGDHATWLGRTAAAHEAALRQPEVDPRRTAMVGYCFGGSSALEYARSGGDLRGVVAVHPGLDLLPPRAEWSSVADLRVLVCVGSEDPMATAEQRDALTGGLTRAEVDWELDLYGGAVHAFTNPALTESPAPHVIKYDPRSAARAWQSTQRLLAETLTEPDPGRRPADEG